LIVLIGSEKTDVSLEAAGGKSISKGINPRWWTEARLRAEHTDSSTADENEQQPALAPAPDGPGSAPESACAWSVDLALRGKPLFRASQPGELCVQQGDGVGRGLLRRGAERGGLGWRRHYGDAGAAGALVSPEGSAAPRPDEAQLQRGLIKENERVVGHQCLPDTTFALPGNTSKSKVLANQLLTIKEVRSSEPFMRYSHMT
jgi:hypothetical protein